MGLTIGSLHMMGTLTQEQQAANPYRLERDGRVSLYDNGWDNPLPCMRCRTRFQERRAKMCWPLLLR